MGVYLSNKMFCIEDRLLAVKFSVCLINTEGVSWALEFEFWAAYKA